MPGPTNPYGGPTSTAPGPVTIPQGPTNAIPAGGPTQAIPPELLLRMVLGAGQPTSGPIDPDQAGQQALTSAIFNSPFYSGQPSGAGPVGQVAQAVLPILAGLDAREAARTNALSNNYALDLKRKEAIANLMQKQMQILNTRSEINTRESKEARAAATDRQRQQFMADAFSEGFIPTGYSYNGLTLANPNYKSSIERALGPLGEAIRGFAGQSHTTPVQLNGQTYFFTANPTGGGVLSKAPDSNPKEIKSKLNAISMMDDYASRLTNIIKNNPDAATSSAAWTNAVAGFGYNVSDFAEKVVGSTGSKSIKEYVKQKFIPANMSTDFPALASYDPNGKPIDWGSSGWYKALYSSDSDAIQQLTALMLYKAAEILGQSGRGISDEDIERMKDTIFPGSSWGTLTPTKMLANLETMQHNNNLAREAYLNELETLISPGGRIQFDLPPKYRADPNGELEEEFQKHFDMLTTLFAVPPEEAGPRSKAFVDALFPR